MSFNLRPHGATAGHRPARTTLVRRTLTAHSAWIAAAVCLGSTSTSALAQPDAQTLTVTGTRVPQRTDQALAEVTVIDRTQIEAAGGRTLAELLGRSAGVQMWANGGAGQTATVSLRGLEGRHTLLLIDGVRYGSATVGTPVWDNLPLDAIERIEIVRGPLSGLYGSDAVGGVVQVFTRRGTPGLHPEASLTLGHPGTREVAAGLRFGQGGVDGAVRMQHRRVDGPSATNPRVPFGSFNPDDDGLRQNNASASAGVALGRWRAEASALASRGTVRYDDGPGADSRAALRSEVLGAGLHGPVSEGWRIALRAARSTDEFETLASASAFAALGTIGTVNRQLSLENQFSTPAGTLLALAERVQQTVSRPGAPFAVSQRELTGLALGLNGEAGAFGWQANLRRDRNSQFGSQTTGTLAAGVTLVPGLRAAASWGSSFVAPSFNQLYFPNFGNPALRPEEGRQHEFSLRWQTEVLTLRLAQYEHRIRGYISSGPQPVNIPRTRIEGLSVSADALWGPWSVVASLDTLSPLNATAGSANFGRVLPRRVQDSARLALDRQQGAWRMGGTLVAHGPRFEDAANNQRLGGFATLDLRAERRLAPAWTLALALNNLLDKRHETVLGYDAPRREAAVTLRYAAR